MNKQEPKDKTFDVLRFVADNAGLSIFEAIEKAYNMGLCEQEPCNDCISRQYLLDNCVVDKITMPYVPVNKIENAPHVTPQQKTGQWILQPSNKDQGERDFIWWKCSECGQVIFSETERDRKEFHAFCGRCGAKMLSTDSNCDSCKYQNEVDGSNCYECVKGIRDNYTKENVSRIKVESGE